MPEDGAVKAAAVELFGLVGLMPLTSPASLLVLVLCLRVVLESWVLLRISSVSVLVSW